MNIYFTIVTKVASYHFVVNQDYNLARITKLIRKDQQGHDCSTTMTVATARKFAKQLQLQNR